jgi:putative ABC transport system permease protein
MRALWRDVRDGGRWRQACRSLTRRPTFAAAAVLTLALGTGTTTALFSLVDTVLIRSLPYPNGDRLVTVFEANSSKHEQTSLIAPVRLEDWNRLNQTFDGLSGAYSENVTDTSGPDPERLSGRRVTPRYFAVFGMDPVAGRAFTPDEERFGGPTAAMISEGLWTRRFLRNREAIGHRLVIGGTGYTIVGVMPRSFAAAAIDVWLPAQTPPYVQQLRDARFLSGVGRLKPGVTIVQATDDLVRVQRALGEQFPRTDKDWSASVGDLKEGRVGQYRRALWLALGAVALLWLIAVANIAGLMLVQMQRRAREFAIRTAIGAARRHVVGAVMREGAVIALVGGVAGAAVAAWLVQLLGVLFATLPRIGELAVNWRALSVAAFTSLAAALTVGLLPALYATRGRLAVSLSHGGRAASGHAHRLQKTLVTAQVSLSILLAGSAALLLRSYYNLSHVETGFNVDNTVTFHVGARWDEDRTRIGELQARLIADLEQLPDVEAAGMTNFLPATGATLRYQVAVDGLAGPESNGAMTAGARTVSSGYLRALHVPLRAGAWCPDIRFDFKAPRTAMVNQRFIDRFAGGASIVGRQMHNYYGSAVTIVGVLGDVAEDGLGVEPVPYVYGCDSAGAWPDPEYVVRTRDPKAFVAEVRQLVHTLDPTRALFGVRPVGDVVSAALDTPRLNAGMLSLFAAAAVTLASLGLYSLFMLLVSERRREMGVRLALGASPRQMVRLVFAGAGRLLLVGIVAGMALTVALSRLLGAVLFGVSPLDVPALAAGTLILAAVSMVAVAIPAFRASGVDPIEAMRGD